ncbi:hypothetical protein B0H19DRAFT_1272788 [Mycena capillaripes]|nr:hypothetical protein B0H19DRAFT_1272788 [Mycena capillaripes]
MVLGLRCPTDAPPELRMMFRNAVAACDGVRADDERLEAEKKQQFEVTDWIICANGDEDKPEKTSLVVRLHQTYEANGGNDPSPATRTPRRRITRISSATDSPASDGTDVVMDSTGISNRERQIGDKYPPDSLQDHRGPYFAHEKAQLIQRDYRDSDGSLIAPHELYGKLVEGTLVLVKVSLVTYIITGQTTENGAPKPDRKVYHILVDQLKILDHGDGEPWNPPIPSLPERRYYSPMTSKRPNDAFNNFGSSRQAPQNVPGVTECTLYAS